MGKAARLRVAAVTLDFGNTLARVDRPGLRSVVEVTADGVERAGIARNREGFLAAWSEERDRQFREEVPKLREVDIDQRAIRVIARLRGMAPPPPEQAWDDAAAAELVSPSEIAKIVDAYSAAFVERIRPVEDAAATLRRLSERGFRLAILSNWPLAVTIDRFAEAHGWLPFLQAIVVSQRVGMIKPHPDIFRAAEAGLGLPQESAAGRVLHVGDDWAADVVGAVGAGWRAAYLRGRQADTPLPTSEPGDDLVATVPVRPDLEIDELAELDANLELDADDAVDAEDAAAGSGGSEAARPGT